MNTETHNTLQNGYEALLFGYASGCLDEAQNLIVASHLTFSSKAREFIKRCEAIGGAIIETECEPVSMSTYALENVMAQIDAPSKTQAPSEKSEHPENPLDFDVPTPIVQTLASQKIEWKTLFPGMKAMDLDLNCKESTARFMAARPGLVSPHHSHKGMEITLVLDGAFSDETGQYHRGDLIVTDETHDHTPTACKMMGCTCLVITTAPIKLKGIASLLNPFLKP